MRSGSVNVICITLAISPFEAFYELVEAFNCRRTGAARGLEQLISNNHYTNAGLKANPTGPWTCSGTGHPIGGLNPAARLIVPFLRIGRIQTLQLLVFGRFLAHFAPAAPRPEGNRRHWLRAAMRCQRGLG